MDLRYSRCREDTEERCRAILLGVNASCLYTTRALPARHLLREMVFILTVVGLGLTALSLLTP